MKNVARSLLSQPDASGLDEALEKYHSLYKPGFEGILSSQEVLNMFQSSLKMYEITGTEAGAKSV